MVTKREFSDFMTDLHGEEDYSDLYKSFKTFAKVKDRSQIKELQDLIKMSPKQRLAYRYALAANGKELTPKQVDQYLSTIEYALSHSDDNN
jgi:predicted solute-binding protein